MSIAHGSHRQTGDVDFTAIIDPEPYASTLKASLNPALLRAAAELGYVDIACAVQRFEYKPRREGFEGFIAPGLKITIGYADRGTREEARLKSGQSIRVVQVDVSFRERVIHPTELVLRGTEVSIQAYAIEEIIVEKLRALLQQPERERNRRQDVYDVDWLLTRYEPDTEMRASILEALRTKSEDRGLTPGVTSFDEPEVRRRSAAEWESMELEIGKRLPNFDEAFGRIVAFYRSLPWK